MGKWMDELNEMLVQTPALESLSLEQQQEIVENGGSLGYYVAASLATWMLGADCRKGLEMVKAIRDQEESWKKLKEEKKFKEDFSEDTSPKEAPKETSKESPEHD